MKPLDISLGFTFGLMLFAPLALSAIYVSNAIDQAELRAEMVATVPTKPTNQSK